MTRGVMRYYAPDGLYASTEFNGNMYPRPDGYGLEIIDEMQKLRTAEEFVAYVERFNVEEFQYKDEFIVGKIEPPYEDCGWEYCAEDATSNLIKDWNVTPDYTYIKNASGKAIGLVGKDGSCAVMEDGEMCVLSYDEIYPGTLLCRCTFPD